ncbi:MAG: hypothetical protein WAW92_04595, partial [Minisyncoccia bacterium]
MEKKEKFMKFSEIDIGVKNANIVLDVDGTLVFDKGGDLPNEVLKAIKKLSEDNDVFIASN